LADLLSPASLPGFQARWSVFLQQGNLQDLELEFVRKDGSLMPALLNATAIRNAKGVFQMSRSIVYDMTERHKMEEERRQHAQRMTELSRHLVDVQETARRQLSGELHDRTSPNLAAIGINFSLIAQEVAALVSTDLSARLEDIRALLKDTSASIHEICSNLRPPILDYAGFPAALASLAQQFSGRTGITVHCTCADQSRRLAPDIESLLFRIAQESLTNCAKHAQATTIDLDLDNLASPIVMRIADDGAGFVLAALGTPGERCGLGILNMRDMAEFAGGKLSIDSTPGQGTRIHVEIP
jgi:signal transduction histidine kinase